MLYEKRLFDFCVIVSLFVIFFGCAASSARSGNVNMSSRVSSKEGAFYYPKLPHGIETFSAVKKDLSALLANRGIPVGITFTGKYSYMNDYANIDKIYEMRLGSGSQPRCDFRSYNNRNILMYMRCNTILVTDRSIELSPLVPFFYTDLKGYPVSVTVDKDRSPFIYSINLPDSISIHFHESDLTDAQRMADDLFFIQKLQDKEIAEQERRLAVFEAKAAWYRAMKIKPPMSEDQRRYIVQANAANQHKDYAGAIDLYDMAIGVDPVSYPEAYFNMALLFAQMGRYRNAITHMKQYLLLVPEAKDARSAQDKIYEWEFMMSSQTSSKEKAGTVVRTGPPNKYRAIRNYGNGDRFEGEFLNGQFHGKGTYTYANGDRFEGEFLNGQFAGQGTFTCSNGKQFIGELAGKEPLGLTVRCK